MDLSTGHIEFERGVGVPEVKVITISNTDLKKILTFKIKTTDARFFSVTPNPAKLYPGESVQVEITRLADLTTPTNKHGKEQILVMGTMIDHRLDPTPIEELWPKFEHDKTFESGIINVEMV